MLLLAYQSAAPRPCESSPCIRGECIDLGTSAYLCLCPAGFSGDSCEIHGKLSIVTGIYLHDCKMLLILNMVTNQ